MFRQKDRSRFHLGRNLIFSIIVTTITLLTAAGSNAAVFSFSDLVQDLLGIERTQFTFDTDAVPAHFRALASLSGEAFAAEVPPVTEVAFSSPTYIEDESQTALIKINRTGDFSGTTTVSFSTSGGTATGGMGCTAGVDYISITNQVVTFNPNDTTQFKFVNICGDSLTEPFQTVNLILNGSDVGTPGTAVLTINDTANMYRSTNSIDSLGTPAAPYPSVINVFGAPNEIGSMRVTLYDFSAQIPDNIDALLVGPGGQKFILMADAGGAMPISPDASKTLTFSDVAGQVLPDSASMITGQFEPTSWEPGQADFPPNAPAAPYNEPGNTVGGNSTQTLFGNFGGTNSNGFWNLYVRDDTGLFAPVSQFGSISGGWGLEFQPLPPPIDVVINSSGNLPPGTYHNITINAPAEVSMTSGIVITGTLTISNGGRLNTNNFVLSGAGSFVLADGGWLQIGDANGITSGTALSGSIQTTGGRSFSMAGNYEYAGTTNQLVGNGLPGTVASLMINNSGIVGNNTVFGSLGQVVTGLLEIVDGVYESHSDYVDVIIDAAGTLELLDNITVSGNWTNTGTLIANGKSVTFDGGTGQTISGTTTFHTFIKSNGGGQSMFFAAGSSTVVTNSLNFTGASGIGNALTLRSTVNGSQWNLTAPTTQSVTYVDVKDSNASSGTLVTATNSFDNGNNNNWSITVPVESTHLSGIVTLANAPATVVPDVEVSAAGGPPFVANGQTNTSGIYDMTGFGAGSYTIMPSKTPYPIYVYNGVFSNDATLISRHVVGLITLTPEQLKAGKVSGLPNLSSFEAALVAQYIVGIQNPINQTGMWEFTPVSTSLIVSTNSTANFAATLMGDVNGDWTDCTYIEVICRQQEEIPDPERISNGVQASVASYKVSPRIEVIVPFSISNLRAKRVDSYQFDIEYDPEVIAPADIAASLAGTLSEGMALAFNVPQKGLLKVVVYGAYPAKGDGIYLDLRFRIIGSEGTSSPLTIRNFRFNDGSSDVYSTAGWLYVVSENGDSATK